MSKLRMYERTELFLPDIRRTGELMGVESLLGSWQRTEGFSQGLTIISYTSLKHLTNYMFSLSRVTIVIVHATWYW